jgi:hypothetical protein
MKTNLIKSVTATFLGDAEIFRKGFKEFMAAEKTIKNYSDVIHRIEETEAIQAYMSRLSSYGTVSSTGDASGLLSVYWEYNLETNLYISAGVSINSGKNPVIGPAGIEKINSEFGLYPDVFYTSLRVYF